MRGGSDNEAWLTWVLADALAWKCTHFRGLDWIFGSEEDIRFNPRSSLKTNHRQVGMLMRCTELPTLSIKLKLSLSLDHANCHHPIPLPIPNRYNRNRLHSFKLHSIPIDIQPESLTPRPTLTSPERNNSTQMSYRRTIPTCKMWICRTRTRA